MNNIINHDVMYLISIKTMKVEKFISIRKICIVHDMYFKRGIGIKQYA